MNAWLLSSSFALAGIAAVHSAMGEMRIFLPWARTAPEGVRRFHQQILRGSWHLPSLMGAGQAALLALWAVAPASELPSVRMQQLMLMPLAAGVGSCGVLVLWLTRGRHPGGTALVITGGLIALGLARADVA